MTAVAIESSFTWLDHSDRDAQQAREVLKALDEGTTVDSIGIGTVRDAIADLLFPAISTLHTRARYFLFVPWIYRELETERVPSARIADVGRQRELQLIRALRKGCEHGTQGIIGQVAGDQLKQLPRIVYWNGTAALGIRRFPGSIRQYFQSVDGYYRRLRRDTTKDDDPEAGGRVLPNWDPSLPEPPANWHDACNLELTADEAQYLVDRAQTSIRSTLLAELLSRGRSTWADFPWEVDDQQSLPVEVRSHLTHARWFSESIHGAQLLYNLMVAEAVADDLKQKTDDVDLYRQAMDDWAALADRAAEERATWDRAAFWQAVYGKNPRIPRRAQRFVDDWLDAVDGGATSLADELGWRERISQRERRLKGAMARLSNPRARERWGGATGAGQLSFRWPEASTAVNDIAAGRAAVP